jgi:ribosome maturation factor RimP
VEVREEVRQLALPLAEEAGYELVDVEFVMQGRARVIRVLLDRPGGITVGNCAEFSRRLGDCLEMNQTVPGAYRLEVSSPGIERPLTTLDAIRRFAGKRAALTLRDAIEGRRRYEGILQSPDGERVAVLDDDEAMHWFDWADVKSARLVVDPWAEARETRATAKARRPRGGDR